MLRFWLCSILARIRTWNVMQYQSEDWLKWKTVLKADVPIPFQQCPSLQLSIINALCYIRYPTNYTASALRKGWGLLEDSLISGKGKVLKSEYVNSATNGTQVNNFAFFVVVVCFSLFSSKVRWLFGLSGSCLLWLSVNGEPTENSFYGRHSATHPRRSTWPVQCTVPKSQKLTSLYTWSKQPVF